jgi:tetratricopeptide (TPR) repeat protein
MKLGDTLEALGRHDEALAALREALAIFERQLGPDHVRLASCLEYIARVQVDLGHLREAHQTITRAVAMLDRLFGVNSTNQRSALLTLGAIEIKLGTPARALAPLERAYALGADTDPGVYAEIEWQLGRALVDTGRDAARGMRLVRAARTVFEHDARTGDDLRELQAWSRRR